jgi:deoxyribodipyrimidine photo-lyase
MGSVFLFHRDLRLPDNTALLQAIRMGHAPILPVFVFPEAQIDPKRNGYFSAPAVRFMCDSLAELAGDIAARGSRLLMLRGDTVAALSDLKRDLGADFAHLYFNEDLSAFAAQRDAEVRRWCERNGVACHTCEDYGLIGKAEGLLSDGRPYRVLAQYYARFQKDLRVRRVDSKRVREEDLWPIVRLPRALLKKSLTVRELRDFAPIESTWHAGRRAGLAMLRGLRQHADYARQRDFPAVEGTTRASPFLRFGVISVREMYWAIHKTFGTGDHALIRELVFRDFYMKIYTHQPELQRGTAFRASMDAHIPWKSPEEAPHEWRAWTTGATGIPLVDAGMQQLAADGWMHNRVRMLVASVATRHLLLDWRACARFFYTRLVDADPFSNTAGWQWAAGIGVDSAPYFRAPFNPYLQSRRFDKDAAYIKRWLPELRDVTAAHLHRWGEPKVRALYPNVAYPAPIVDVAEASRRSVALWRRAASKSA